MNNIDESASIFFDHVFYELLCRFSKFGELFRDIDVSLIANEDLSHSLLVAIILYLSIEY